jgi:hypothetical protein
MTREDLKRLHEALVAEQKRWEEIQELAPGPLLRGEARRRASDCQRQVREVDKQCNSDPDRARA